ncbi:hypothetical protein ACA910_019109 [Epithemia clementina (nom. ined.)]
MVSLWKVISKQPWQQHVLIPEQDVLTALVWQDQPPQQNDNHNYNHNPPSTKQYAEPPVVFPSRIRNLDAYNDRTVVMTIFYHIFLPGPLISEKLRALTIVQEQLEAIANASWSINHDQIEDNDNRRKNWKRATKSQVVLYYNTVVGIANNANNNNNNNNNNHTHQTKNNDTYPPDHVLVQNVVNAACTKYRFLHCQPLAYYPDGGDESITLASLFDYCHSYQQVQQQQQQQTQGTHWMHRRGVGAGGDRVTYLHNKGSFHNGPENHFWRQALTAAALHADCVDPPPWNYRPPKQPPSYFRRVLRFLKQWLWPILLPPTKTRKSTCDVCALNFEAAWTQFFPGNMWTAHCEYIVKLVSPRSGRRSRNTTTTTTTTTNVSRATDVLPTTTRTTTNDDKNDTTTMNSSSSTSSWTFSLSYDYQQRKQDMAVWAQRHHPKNFSSFSLFNFTYHLYPERYERDDFWGLGRFANEHWIGSHPDLIPCELSESEWQHWQGVSYLEHGPDVTKFVWSRAPRRTMVRKRDPKSLPLASETLVQTVVHRRPELRRYEYVLLAGSLFRWIGLYNQTPPYPSSWVWKFYPDADYWHDQIPAIRAHLLPLVQQASSSSVSPQQQQQEHHHHHQQQQQSSSAAEQQAQ